MNETKDCCDQIVAFLEGVREGERSFDHERLSEMMKSCPSCLERVTEHFRALEVGDSGYLEETIDDLTHALYNLVKALMKPDEDTTDSKRHRNVVFVNQPGDPDDYLADGQEMIEDVQDFTGADHVRGESMESLRSLAEEARARFDIAVVLLEKAAELNGRHSLDCLNLLGILSIDRGELSRAEDTFRKVIRSGSRDVYSRKVQVHAMNNLSFLCVEKGEVDEAIVWATRARGLAEETSLDPFGARFGLLYFHLRRAADGDLQKATSEGEWLTANNERSQILCECLTLENNAAIRELVVSSGLAEQLALELN